MNKRNNQMTHLCDEKKIEICQRPWGYYKVLEVNDNFQSKMICIKPKGQLSLQSHEYRDEYWVVTYGNGIVHIDEMVKKVAVGETIIIPKRCKHRLINTNSKEYLQIVEVQLGDYFGEDDIIRYEDIYGRV